MITKGKTELRKNTLRTIFCTISGIFSGVFLVLTLTSSLGLDSILYAQSPPLTSQSGKTRSIEIGDGVILELVWVPGSTFPMGSRKSPSELAEIYQISDEAFTPEQPLHEVTVNGFWMGKYEVTNAQFRRHKPSHISNIQDKNGQPVFSFFCKKYRGYSFDGENQPVVNVSWEEARDFCGWLSEKTGETVRLPFEAEWEYAGRAGTDSLYYWGNDEKSVGAYENIYDLSAEKELKLTHNAVETTDSYTVTSPVGLFKPNGFGLYDMAGNVSEWCSDWYRSKYYSDSQKMNPQGPLKGKARVIRGGNWECCKHEIRPSFRRGSLPDHKAENIGFRIVIQ